MHEELEDIKKIQRVSSNQNSPTVKRPMQCTDSSDNSSRLIKDNKNKKIDKQ